MADRLRVSTRTARSKGYARKNTTPRFTRGWFFSCFCTTGAFFRAFATNGDAFFRPLCNEWRCLFSRARTRIDRAREENAQGLRMSSKNKNAYAQYAEGNRWKKLDSGFKSRKM